MFFESVSLTKQFGGLVAVSEVSFSIAQGDIVGVFGPNGSGKTTLLNLMAGVYAPTSGRLMWKSECINGSRPHEIASRGIVKTFQNPQLFSELSVRENVMIAGHLKVKRALGLRRLRSLVGSGKQARDAGLSERVDEVLRLCRLDRFGDQAAGSLSYGGEKMLGVAMALMCEPELLLLDEPGTGLGHEEIQNLDEVLRGLRAHGTTLCVIDHRVSFLSRLADRTIAMHHGRKIVEGTPQEVLSDERVVEAYLGRGRERADA